MTNGGGDTELAKSNQFSSTLGLSPKNKLKEREIILPFVDKIGRGKGQKRLAIFDLDETLIHCELNPDNSAQTKIEVVLPNKTTKEIGLNIRPHWKEELLKIKTKYYLIMYTASHHSYADSVLNYLDPKKEIFDLRLYRNNCTIVNYEGKTFYIKDLRILKDVSLKDMVIIDNSVLFSKKNYTIRLQYNAINSNISETKICNISLLGIIVIIQSGDSPYLP